MELKQGCTFARLWYLFVALWQAVQSTFLIFCLVSNTWIVSIDSVFSKGLFEQCVPENLTCVTSDICSNCSGYNSTIICQKSENKTETVDEEFVGGLLVTKVMFRVIVGFISICLFAVDENSGKDFRVEFPKGLTVFEEFCGVCDVAIVGLHLLVNDEFLRANSCSRLGIAFWLNLIRPLTAFIVHRVLFPSTRACAKRCFAKIPSDDTHEEQNASTDLKLTFQNAGTSNEPSRINHNTDQKRKPSIDWQPRFQNGEQPGTSNEQANQNSRTDQKQKPPTELKSTFQNWEQSGTSNEPASDDSKSDLERMSSTEHQPTFQREQPGTSNEPASQVFDTEEEEKSSTDLQLALQNGEQPVTSNEPAALDSKTDVKRVSSAEQQPTFQREHPDTQNEPVTKVSNTDIEQKPVADGKSIFHKVDQPGTSNETTEQDYKTDLEQKPSTDSRPIYLSEEQTGTSNEPFTRHSTNTDRERKTSINLQSTCQNEEHAIKSNEPETQVTKL